MKQHSSILAIVFGLLILNKFYSFIYLNYFIIFLCFICLISKKITILIYNIWLRFSIIISNFFPKIILIIVFFLVLTPLAFLSKIFKAKSNFISENKLKSMFININKSFSKNSFKRTF